VRGNTWKHIGKDGNRILESKGFDVFDCYQLFKGSKYAGSARNVATRLFNVNSVMFNARVRPAQQYIE